LWSRIIFKKSGYNFLENAVLAFYTQGHLIWLAIAGSLVFKFTGSSYNSANFLVSTIYFCWSYAAFYSESRPKVYFKGLLVQLLMMITFMLFIILVLVAGLIIYIKFIDPEFLKNL